MFTNARGSEAVFWQSPRTRKQGRLNVSTPTARAADIVDLQIIVDSPERYAYRFADQHVRTTKRALPCGDTAWNWTASWSRQWNANRFPTWSPA